MLAKQRHRLIESLQITKVDNGKLLEDCFREVKEHFEKTFKNFNKAIRKKPRTSFVCHPLNQTVNRSSVNHLRWRDTFT